MGKSEQFVQALTYQPIRGALTKYIREIIVVQSENLNQSSIPSILTLQNSIMEHVGDDYCLLLELIPSLSEIMSTQGSSATNDGNTNTVQDTASISINNEIEKHTRQALHRLVRAVVSLYSQPLILFLDDMQWIDIKSLQLVKEMLMDETLSGKLMVTGTCRGNEVAYTDDLSISLREFEDLYNLTILSIELRNLQLGDVPHVVENFLQS